MDLCIHLPLEKQRVEIKLPTFQAIAPTLHQPDVLQNKTNVWHTKRLTTNIIRVKKTNGQKQFLDQRQNEDLPDYDHEEIITIED